MSNIVGYNQTKYESKTTYQCDRSASQPQCFMTRSLFTKANVPHIQILQQHRLQIIIILTTSLKLFHVPPHMLIGGLASMTLVDQG